MMMSKHRSSLTSERLLRVLRVLRAAGSRGLSIIDMMMQASVSDPKDCIYEIRWNWERIGYVDEEIVSEWHESVNGVRDVRYVLAARVAEVA